MFNHAYWQYLILLVAELICSTRKGCHSGRSARSRSPNSCYSSTLSAGPTKYNAARATHEAMRAHHELPRTGLAELCHIHPSSPPQPVLSCSSADVFFRLLHAVGHFSNPIEKSSSYRGGEYRTTGARLYHTTMGVRSSPYHAYRSTETRQQ